MLSRGAAPAVLVLSLISAVTAAAPPPPVGSTTVPEVVARVNGVAISRERLASALSSLLPMSAFHRNVDGEKVAQLRRTALEDLIDEELRFQAGAKSGIRPTEREIAEGLSRAVAAYKTPADFEQARRRSGARLDAIRAEIARALVIQKAWQRSVGSSCLVSARDAERFYVENPARFVVPEQLHLRVMTIGVDPSAPASAWAEAKKRADDVRRQLGDGLTFEDAVKRYSTDKHRDHGGDLGYVHRGSVAAEFETAVNALKPGDITDVVQSLQGYHVIQLVAIKPPERKALTDVAAGLQRDLTAKRCRDMTTDWTAALRAGATIIRVATASQSLPGGRGSR